MDSSHIPGYLALAATGNYRLLSQVLACELAEGYSTQRSYKGESGSPNPYASFLQQTVCVYVVGVESGEQGWLGLLLAMQVRPMPGDSIFNVQVHAFRACGGLLITINVLRQNVA